MTIVHDSTAAVNDLAESLADSTAPRMGVHTISEIQFCKRAGLMVIDQKSNDEGSEFEPAPALGGLPTHDVEAIKQAISVVRQQLRIPIAWNIAWMIVLLCGVVTRGIPALLLFGTAQYYSFQWLLSLLRDYQFLRSRLLQAENAAIREPDWTNPVPQPINWWCLIRAGFVSVEKRRPFEDSLIGVSGRPWRVLSRGSRGIPVLRINEDLKSPDRQRNGELHRNQMARVGAYAYLISRLERADVSWAIVLFGRSDEGVAIPLTDPVWNAFKSAVLTARRVVAESRRDPTMIPAVNGRTTVCSGCPFGKPQRVVNSSAFRESQNPLFVTQTSNGVPYHSDCGDRYRWVPPHQDAIQLGLTTGNH